MIRFFAYILAFVMLIVLQISFINSLPQPFCSIPFVFVCATFLFQYVSVSQIIWWIVFEGFFLDLLGIGTVPLETLTYSISAVCVATAASHLFSNRSYYGLAANTILGLFVLASVEMVFSIFIGFFSTNVLGPTQIFTIRFSGMLLSLPMLFLIFPLAKPTRRLIQLLLPI